MASFSSMGRFMTIIGLLPSLFLAVGIVVIALLYKLTDSQAAEYAKLNAEREAAAKAGN